MCYPLYQAAFHPSQLSLGWWQKTYTGWWLKAYTGLSRSSANFIIWFIKHQLHWMHQFKGWIFSVIRNPLHRLQGQSILKVTTMRKPGKLRLRKCSQMPYNSNGEGIISVSWCSVLMRPHRAVPSAGVPSTREMLTSKCSEGPQGDTKGLEHLLFTRCR